MTDAVGALLFTGVFAFLTGVYLLLSFRNLLRLLLAVEALAKGVTLILLAAGLHRGALPLMQSFIITFIVVETVLAAILLAIIVLCQKTNASLDIRLLSRLRG